MRKTPGTPTTPFSLSARKQQMEWPVTPVLKGVLREALALSQTTPGMLSKPGLQVVLLLLNNGTMSRVHDIYSALCNLQSAFLSLDPENKPAGG